jgi:tetratricopeptide (TPR) repeat protein
MSNVELSGASARPIAELREAVMGAPRTLAHRFALGQALMAAGQYAEAVDTYGDLLDLAPAEPTARLGRAKALLAVGDLAGSEAEFRSVQRMDKTSSAAALGLAQVRRERGDFEGAMAAIRFALRLAPEDVDARALLGWIQLDLGDVGAVATFRNVLWKDARHADARLGLLAAGAGKARVLLEGIDATPKVKVAKARRARSRAERVSAVASLEALLTDTLPAPERARVSATLGDLYDRLGQPERAMVAWTAANQSTQSAYDGAAHQARNDGLREVFSPERVASRDAAGPFGGPVLVVGAVGAGVGLVRRLIAAHPDAAAVRARAPVHRLARQLPRYTAQPWPDCVDHLQRAGGAHLGARWQCDLEQSAGQAQVVLDATPTDIAHLGLVALMAPGTRVVVVRRNPWDTALSAFRRPLRGEHGARSRTLDDLAAAMSRDAELLDHWEQTLPLAFHSVDYEALVQRPGKSLSQLWDFLGLSTMPATENLRADRVGGWYRYARWIAPLVDTLAA